MNNPFPTNPADEKVDAPNFIRHIDHVTYVAALENEDAFCQTWKNLGFVETVRLRCPKYPANHIALTAGQADGFPWATMTGLSTSEDPASPINEFVRRHGPGVQHVAYNVDPERDIHEVYKQLEEEGWSFMTPVLSYTDDKEARLHQFFTLPTAPYGPFVEFTQRLKGTDGKVYGGFDTNVIDDLYKAYDEASQKLL